MKSLGFIEVQSVTAAVDALDIMCKTANVEFVTWERRFGGRIVTFIVKGQLSAVTQAVNAAVEHCIIEPAAHAVIASPHEETARILELSAARTRKTYEAKLASSKQSSADEAYLQEV